MSPYADALRAGSSARETSNATREIAREPKKPKKKKNIPGLSGHRAPNLGVPRNFFLFFWFYCFSFVFCLIFFFFWFFVFFLIFLIFFGFSSFIGFLVLFNVFFVFLVRRVRFVSPGCEGVALCIQECGPGSA